LNLKRHVVDPNQRFGLCELSSCGNRFWPARAD
jgi:hypothetical protein